MSKVPSKPSKHEPTFAGKVGAKASRKLKARRNSTQGIWFGLGMMGLIGWSVAIPTLAGANRCQLPGGRAAATGSHESRIYSGRRIYQCPSGRTLPGVQNLVPPPADG
jgi:hypothetical protein